MEVVAAFRRARRLVSMHEQCLPWALAMARALADPACEARLVIGATVQPFRAHCWVQQGESVLSDRLENVLAFSPVLVV